LNNKANVFAGFYAFSAMPKDLKFGNITKTRPLYTMNAKDDQTFPYSEAAAVYEQHKTETGGWHFNTVATGGHRFIYGINGSSYVKQLLGSLILGR
jgi:predicted esterase